MYAQCRSGRSAILNICLICNDYWENCSSAVWNCPARRTSALAASIMRVDLGIRLMQLYRMLRNATDRTQRDAIKAEIDTLMAETHAEFSARPMIVGSNHFGRKMDA